MWARPVFLRKTGPGAPFKFRIASYHFAPSRGFLLT